MSQIKTLYQQLKFIRQFELEVAKVYPTDKIKSPVHLSIGQEFVSVAICSALKELDHVAATYRGHAAYLAKGGAPEKLLAEMYGKDNGCAKGRGGSMHLIEPEKGIVGTSAVVGTGVPIAAGYALSEKMRNSGNIVVCFLGDGATEEGCFYESLNFSGLHELPILYVVENNKFAIHEPISKRWAQPELMERVSGFNLSTYKHNDGCILSLTELAENVINDVRNGNGPGLIEVDCCRWYQHVGPNIDTNQNYRDSDEIQRWMENDQVKKLQEMLSDDELIEIDKCIEKSISYAFEYAENGNFPDVKELFNYVYK